MCHPSHLYYCTPSSLHVAVNSPFSGCTCGLCPQLMFSTRSLTVLILNLIIVAQQSESSMQLSGCILEQQATICLDRGQLCPRLGPSQKIARSKEKARHAVPNARGYRGIEALDRWILGFQGNINYRRMVGLTSYRRCLVQTLIYSVQTASEGHVCCYTAGVAIQRGSLPLQTPTHAVAF
jgi:hypothetical protein